MHSNCPKKNQVNIFTDSKYAFGVLHAPAGLWKQRGMLTAQGSPVKYGPQILRLLEAVQLPLEVAVGHYKAHQREDQDVTRGNARADKEAKHAATLMFPQTKNTYMHALIPSVGKLPTPQYSGEEKQLADKLGLQEKEGWLHSPEGKVLLPKGLILPVLQKLHQTTHAGREALIQVIKKYFILQTQSPSCPSTNKMPSLSKE
ncbi:unnamed protein product [Eretmochelys imbricata]